MSEVTRFPGSIRTLFPYMREYRRRFLLAFTLVVIVVVAELAQPWLIKEAIDRYVAVATPDPAAILWLSAGYLLLSLLAFGLTYSQEVLLQSAGQAIVRT